MRRILFTETNLNNLPVPPTGYRYIGFDGHTFSIQSETGTEATGLQGPQGPIGPTGSGGGGGGDVPTELWRIPFGTGTGLTSKLVRLKFIQLVIQV